MEQIRRHLNTAASVELTDKNSPQTPHAKGEEVLGVANEEVQRAYAAYSDAHGVAYAEQEKNRARLRKIQRTPAPILSAEDEAFLNAHNLRNRRVEIAAEMLWHTVFEQFPSAIGHHVAIRKGWLIVQLSEDSEGHCAGCDGCSPDLKAKIKPSLVALAALTGLPEDTLLAMAVSLPPELATAMAFCAMMRQ